jgi:hypothetical protein
VSLARFRKSYRLGPQHHQTIASADTEDSRHVGHGADTTSMSCHLAAVVVVQIQCDDSAGDSDDVAER